MKKTATEIIESVCVYGKHVASQQTCEYWLRSFKSSYVDIEDKKRARQPKKFEDTEPTEKSHTILPHVVYYEMLHPK